jgi:hypothetical protein
MRLEEIIFSIIAGDRIMQNILDKNVIIQKYNFLSGLKYLRMK